MAVRRSRYAGGRGRLLNFLVEPRQHRGGCSCRREHAGPAGEHLHAGHASFRQCRHVGQAREALGAGIADRADFAGLDERQRRRRRHEHDLDVAGDQPGDGRRRAAVGHMHHLRLGQRLEQFGSKVKPVADAGRAERDLIVATACERDQLRHRPRRQVGIDPEDISLGRCDIADRLEVADHVERQLLVEARIDHERARRDQQRVAVGRRFRDGLGADDAVGARPILHHEGLPGLGGELLADDASDHVRRAAGGERHDHAHRLARIRLRDRAGAQRPQCPGQDDNAAPAPIPAHRASFWASARLDARHELEHVLALDGLQIRRAEAPVRDALVDLGAVTEGKVGAVHHLRDRHHLEQRRDLAGRVALRQLVIELLELGQRAVGQVRGLALLGEPDEAAGQERQRAAAMGEDPADVGEFRRRAAEDDMRDGAREIRGVFDRAGRLCRAPRRGSSPAWSDARRPRPCAG